MIREGGNAAPEDCRGVCVCAPTSGCLGSFSIGFLRWLFGQVDVVAAACVGLLGWLLGQVDVVAASGFRLFGLLRVFGLLRLLGLLGRVVRTLFGGEDLLFVVLDLCVHELDEGVAFGRVVVKDGQRVDHLHHTDVGGIGGASGGAEGSGYLFAAVGGAAEEQFVHFFVGHFQGVDIGFNAELVDVGGICCFTILQQVGNGGRLAVELPAGADPIVRQVSPEAFGGCGLVGRGGSEEALDGELIARQQGVAFAVGGHNVVRDVALSGDGQAGIFFFQCGLEAVGGCLGDGIGRDGRFRRDSVVYVFDKLEVRTVVHLHAIDSDNRFSCDSFRFYDFWFGHNL